MRRRPKRFISSEEEAYVRLLIANNDDSENRKIGLETLCKLYRSGFILRDRYTIALFTMALLHDSEPRVRRWALNTLALIGTKDEVSAILEAIKRDEADPDILAAGIAALCAIVDDEEARRQLKSAKLPIEGAILLAAAQQSTSFTEELRGVRINIEKADIPQLRLASLLIGLGKAPENFFDGKHENRHVIGQLNRHEDRIVAQYSVWAISENKTLGPKALGIKLKDIESRPEKVKKYIYQTVAADAATARKNRDFLVQGSEDESVEVRSGLAVGLRHTYFDSIEELVLDWWPDEATENVRHRLLEHMATHADRCVSYEKPVLQIYRDAQTDSLSRRRLESAARGTKVSSTMRLIAHEAEADDLFGYGHVPQRIRSFDGPETPLQRAQRIKVLLVTALPKEAAAVKATFDSSEVVGLRGDPNVYEIGVYIHNNLQREVLTASSGMGTLSASALTTNALRSFPQLEHIVMVGIAGGCPNHTRADEHVRLGDIVTSGGNGIIAHDFVKETIDGREIRSSPQRASAVLMRMASSLQADELLGRRPWEAIAATALDRLDDTYRRPANDADQLHEGEEIVDHPYDRQRRQGQPRVFAGVIAAADTLLKNAATRDQLRNQFNVRAVEMEASGVQDAAWHANKDVFVVRGVCDYCDEWKNDDWQNYAALVAAAYARALVQAMPEGWF
ncbi:hypothetical protein [Bradyrhizobium sp. 174]|uniref:phosphorylase family protein n=1 Tax=Bradyrhizobium sp. 174 TaxID=2782645 RepID=UPI001FFBEA05|nr:hypothetical protein [Bradyrhizobium sp. 174]